MPSGAMQNVMRQVRRLVARPGTTALTDEQLLERFIRQQDEESFSTLVRRHGPLVLGVCLRLLHHRQDAEDAFQATFLTLVRKGHTIRQRGALASWLYRVAFRIALRQKARADLRETPEGLGDVPVNSDPAEAAGWSELQPVLDQEMQRLPEKYRRPMIMCYLEGKSYEEAANLLGCPKGTVAIRLLRGRQMLKERLVRRGLMAAAGCVMTLGVLPAAQAVPPVLAAQTTAFAGPVAAGVAFDALVPSTVATLANETCRGIWMQKVQSVCVAVVCLSISGFGLGGGAISLAPEFAPGPIMASMSGTVTPPAPLEDAVCLDVRDVNVRLCIVQVDLTGGDAAKKEAAEDVEEPDSTWFPDTSRPPRLPTRWTAHAYEPGNIGEKFRQLVRPDGSGKRIIAIGVTASDTTCGQSTQAFWFPNEQGKSVFLLLHPGAPLKDAPRGAGLSLRQHLLDDGPHAAPPDDALAAMTQPRRPTPKGCRPEVAAIVFKEQSQVRLFAGLVRIIYMAPSHVLQSDGSSSTAIWVN